MTRDEALRILTDVPLELPLNDEEQEALRVLQEDPREKGDDDGVEYSDPREQRVERDRNYFVGFGGDE